MITVPFFFKYNILSIFSLLLGIFLCFRHFILCALYCVFSLTRLQFINNAIAIRVFSQSQTLVFGLVSFVLPVHFCMWEHICVFFFFFFLFCSLLVRCITKRCRILRRISAVIKKKKQRKLWNYYCAHSI